MTSSDTLPSQLRSILILSFHLSQRHPSRLFPSGFLGKNRVCGSPRCDACHMVCQSHCVSFGHANNIWRSVRITRLLILKICLPPSCFAPFRFGCVPEYFFFTSGTCELCSSLSIRDQVSNTCKRRDMIAVLVIYPWKTGYLLAKRATVSLSVIG
jgi:hypothetical protein